MLLWDMIIIAGEAMVRGVKVYKYYLHIMCVSLVCLLFTFSCKANKQYKDMSTFGLLGEYEADQKENNIYKDYRKRNKKGEVTYNFEIAQGILQQLFRIVSKAQDEHGAMVSINTETGLVEIKFENGDVFDERDF